MMRKYLTVLTVGALLTVAAFAAASSSQKPTVTVGDFAVKVSSAMGHPALSPRAAVESLKSLGVKIEDPSASLTEGSAAKILADLGLRVSTSTPSNAVTAGKADQLAAVVGLASSASSISPDTDLPTQCLDNKNRGRCNDCCVQALGCTLGDPTCVFNTPCAKFCKQVLPPGQQSPSDPIP